MKRLATWTKNLAKRKDAMEFQVHKEANKAST
jgi:hypothetical protein